MLKIIGIILIMFSSSFFGYQKASAYKKRVLELNEFKKGVEMFETEIRFVRTPLCEAFDKIGGKLTGSVSSLFADFSKKYVLLNGMSVNEIWNAVIDENTKNTYLCNDDIKIVKDFGVCLGITDTEGQINNIMSVLDRIESQINCAKDLEQKNAKLYQSLGIYSGVLISILLV